MTAGDGGLVRILERARERGYLGPGAVLPHIVHARGFADLAVQSLERPPTSVVDLGSGGGVPGLVLAGLWPDADVLLVEVSRRRATDLAVAAAEVFGARVQVVAERAEVVAHRPERREGSEVVTARSFGPPALTAEIAAGFVALGGVLIVSEPPGGDPGRWPTAGLARFGFGPAEPADRGASYVVITKRSPSPAHVPRPTRALVKRPAW